MTTLTVLVFWVEVQWWDCVQILDSEWQQRLPRSGSGLFWNSSWSRVRMSYPLGNRMDTFSHDTSEEYWLDSAFSPGGEGGSRTTPRHWHTPGCSSPGRLLDHDGSMGTRSYFDHGDWGRHINKSVKNKVKSTLKCCAKRLPSNWVQLSIRPWKKLSDVP